MRSLYFPASTASSASTDFFSPQETNTKQSNKTDNAFFTPDNYQTSGQWPKENRSPN